MSRRPRRKHLPAFKAKVALAALKGDKTLAELSQQFDLHVNQITQWKTQLLEHADEAFGGKPSEPPPVNIKALQAKIGALTISSSTIPDAHIRPMASWHLSAGTMNRCLYPRPHNRWSQST